MPDPDANFAGAPLSRRSLLQAAGAGVIAAAAAPLCAVPLWAVPLRAAPPPADFRLRYVLGTALYGTTPLAEILAELSKTRARSIDLWSRPHGDQREQVEAMGPDKFVALLKQHDVELGAIACYDLKPEGLAAQMQFVRRLQGRDVVLVTNAPKPGKLRGADLKSAVRAFAAQLKPHAVKAQEASCVIAIENHANTLLDSADSIRWFADASRDSSLGLALAPHHLPQDAQSIAGLVRDVGRCVQFFYAQQYGQGFMKKLPKQQELLQLPGRGTLDFTPILAALQEVGFAGPTEIFMHPTPRGVPILDSTAAITAEINRSESYLQKCLATNAAK